MAKQNKERTKTLVAKRAYLENAGPLSLESILTASFEVKGSPNQRIYQASGDRYILFATREQNPINEGIFVRVFEFEDGAAGVINFEFSRTDAEIEELLPPKNQKFLKDDATLLISGNRIYACGFGNKNRLLALAVENLAAAAGKLPSAAVLNIEDLPNQVTIGEVSRVGAKTLDFGLTDYLNSLEPQNNMRGVLRALLTSPKGDGIHRKRAATQGRIRLNRGRFTKDEFKKDEWLTDVAVAVLEERDGPEYTIILENGKKITASDLKMQKRVSLPKHATTVSYLATKNALIDFSREVAIGEIDDEIIE